eukprot:ANDGO_00022.mRNA.1 hypothetical protein
MSGGFFYFHDDPSSNSPSAGGSVGGGGRRVRERGSSLSPSFQSHSSSPPQSPASDYASLSSSLRKSRRATTSSSIDTAHSATQHHQVQHHSPLDSPHASTRVNRIRPASSSTLASRDGGASESSSPRRSSSTVLHQEAGSPARQWRASTAGGNPVPSSAGSSPSSAKPATPTHLHNRRVLGSRSNLSVSASETMFPDGSFLLPNPNSTSFSSLSTRSPDQASPIGSYSSPPSSGTKEPLVHRSEQELHVSAILENSRAAQPQLPHVAYGPSYRIPGRPSSGSICSAGNSPDSRPGSSFHKFSPLLFDPAEIDGDMDTMNMSPSRKPYTKPEAELKIDPVLFFLSNGSATMNTHVPNGTPNAAAASPPVHVRRGPSTVPGARTLAGAAPNRSTERSDRPGETIYGTPPISDNIRRSPIKTHAPFLFGPSV